MPGLAARTGDRVYFPDAGRQPGLTITYISHAASALLSFFVVPAMVAKTRGRKLEQMTA